MKKIIKYLFMLLLIITVIGKNSTVINAVGHEYTYDDLTEGMTFTGEDTLLLSLNGNSQMWITVLVNGGSSLGTLTYSDYVYSTWNTDAKYKLISKDIELRPLDHWIGYTISFYKYSIITIDPNGANVISVPEGWEENNGIYQKEYLYPDLLSAALAEWDGCLEYDGYEFIEWEHNYELEDDYINRSMDIKARWLSNDTAMVCIDPTNSESIYVPHGFVENVDGKYYKEYSIGTKISDITKEINDETSVEPLVPDDDYNYYYDKFVYTYNGHEDAEVLESNGLTYHPEFNKRLEIEIETSGSGNGKINDEDGYRTSEIFLATGATYLLNDKTLTIYNNDFKKDEVYTIVENDDSKFVEIMNLPETSFASETTLYFVFEKAHKVTFETNGGSQIEPVKVIFGDKLQKPTDPVLPKYRLDAWCSDQELKKPYDFSKAVTNDLTLYARYTCAHEDLIDYPEIPATVLADGRKEYYNCPNCNKYFEDEACNNEILDIDNWLTGKGYLPKQIHRIIEGNGQNFTPGSSKTLSFTSNGIYDGYFVGVKINDKFIEDDCYIAEAGSIVVELTNDYLKTLSLGTYTLSITMDGVSDATTKFNVGEVKPFNPPKTGIE